MRYAVSRFAVVTFEGGSAVVHQARTGRRLQLPAGEAALLGAFAAPSSPEEALPRSGLPPDRARQLVEELAALGVLVTEAERQAEEALPWRAADLWLHAEVREVGDWQRARALPPSGPPAVRPPLSGDRTPLAKLPPERQADPVLTALRRRRSIRVFKKAEVDLEVLGHLLHACAANDRAPHPAAEGSALEIVHRPYPSPSGLYPLELYLAAGAGGVRGLAGPAAFHYCPRGHHLERLPAGPAEVEPFLETARAASSRTEPPPLLLLVTCRMARLSPAYGAGSYALALKEVGCLLQAAALAASQLGLASCVLGGGEPSARLARLGGFDPLEEPLVGELMLGPSPFPSAPPR